MTTSRRNRPISITDAPEHRSIPLERVEIRAGDSGDPNELVLDGYASTYEEYEMYGGPANWGWIERIDPKAFDVTLREKPDLHFLINHAGMPLARTKSGNLDLAADDTGLKVTARLDKRDPDVQALAIKMERGDMDEMSFAFRVKGQEWRAAEGFEDIDDESYRTITEVSLHKGDVSVVNWGANPNTSVGIRSANDAIKMLADCDESELAEVRQDDDTLKRAIENLLSSVVTKPLPDGAVERILKAPGVNIHTLNVLEDGDVPEARADSDEDPSAIIAGIDAAVDQAIALTQGVDRATLDSDVAQALDLLVGIDTLVDELMEMTGTYDPDGDEELSSVDDTEKRDPVVITVAANEAMSGIFAEFAQRIAELEAMVTGSRTEEADARTENEPVEEARSTRLDEALAAQGILPEKLSLAAALAFED